MCRPLLIPVAEPSEVLRHVEVLAGHVADLLAGDGRGLPPDSSILATAREVLDVCCGFIERWNRRARDGAAFDADVRRLRTRLTEMMQRLAFESVATEPKRRKAHPPSLVAAQPCSVCSYGCGY